jgi:hypothetical protein
MNMKKFPLFLIFMIFALFKCGLDVVSGQAPPHYKYRGLETCASTCHNTDTLGYQYIIWKKSPHAQSYQVLASAKARQYARNAGIEGDPQENLKCLQCHSTGAGLDSSYYLTTYRKEDGVTCEACHKVKWILQTVIHDERECYKCHNSSVHKVPKFVYSEKFPLIQHPMPEGKKRGS